MISAEMKKFEKLLDKKSRLGHHRFDTEMFHKHNLPTASWKEMYLTTPAITKIFLLEGRDAYHLESDASGTGQLVQMQGLQSPRKYSY